MKLYAKGILDSEPFYNDQFVNLVYKSTVTDQKVQITLQEKLFFVRKKFFTMVLIMIIKVIERFGVVMSCTCLLVINLVS